MTPRPVESHVKRLATASKNPTSNAGTRTGSSGPIWMSSKAGFPVSTSGWSCCTTLQGLDGFEVNGPTPVGRKIHIFGFCSARSGRVMTLALPFGNISRILATIANTMSPSKITLCSQIFPTGSFQPKLNLIKNLIGRSQGKFKAKNFRTGCQAQKQGVRDKREIMGNETRWNKPLMTRVSGFKLPCT